MTAPDTPITFAGGMLDRHRHVCAFFDSFSEELRIMGPFVKEGLAQGHKAFHIVDPALRTQYPKQLEAAGIDAIGAEARAAAAHPRALRRRATGTGNAGGYGSSARR